MVDREIFAYREHSLVIGEWKEGGKFLPFVVIILLSLWSCMETRKWTLLILERARKADTFLSCKSIN